MNWKVVGALLIGYLVLHTAWDFVGVSGAEILAVTPSTFNNSTMCIRLSDGKFDFADARYIIATKQPDLLANSKLAEKPGGACLTNEWAVVAQK